MATKKYVVTFMSGKETAALRVWSRRAKTAIGLLSGGVPGEAISLVAPLLTMPRLLRQ
jgi:hypothetical protein